MLLFSYRLKCERETHKPLSRTPHANRHPAAQIACPLRPPARPGPAGFCAFLPFARAFCASQRRDMTDIEKMQRKQA